MTHDPMCPIVDRRYYSATCVCDLIARVRADEREKADCPDPSICDRHNCAAAAAYCDGVADERDRIRTELLSLASERAGVAGRNTDLTGYFRRYLIDLTSVLDVVNGGGA
jgi:hypothetical protein